jgi:hypothetical protein
MFQNSTFAAPGTERSIGSILIDSGRLAPDDIEKVLEFQKEAGLRFGEAGIKLGLLTEQDILFALSLQFDYPFLSGPTRPVSEDVVVAYRPFGHEGERLRSLRSQLQLRWFNDSGKQTSLAVVGPHRGEGRSHLAANLAVSFAQAGERTLLIDADLHNASQHRYFKLENGAGLSNCWQVMSRTASCSSSPASRAWPSCRRGRCRPTRRSCCRGRCSSASSSRARRPSASSSSTPRRWRRASTPVCWRGRRARPSPWPGSTRHGWMPSRTPPRW